MSKDQDFTNKDLPQSRLEEIARLLKYRKKTIILLSLLLLPFILPFFFWLIYSRYYLYPTLPNSSQAFLYIVLRDYPLIFLSFLMGSGLSGLFYSLKRLLFRETVRLPYHFFKGIKNTGFEGGLFLSIYSILFIILDVIQMFSRALFQENKLRIFGLIIILILLLAIAIILLMSLPFIFSSISIYVVSFSQALRDGFSSEFRGLGYNLLLFIIFFFPSFFILSDTGIASQIINLVGASLLTLGFLTIESFVFLGRALEIFDKNINKSVYPELYRLGLREEKNES